jgi:hypothetical protein
VCRDPPSRLERRSHDRIASWRPTKKTKNNPYIRSNIRKKTGPFYCIFNGHSCQCDGIGVPSEPGPPPECRERDTSEDRTGGGARRALGSARCRCHLRPAPPACRASPPTAGCVAHAVACEVRRPRRVTSESDGQTRPRGPGLPVGLTLCEATPRTPGHRVARTENDRRAVRQNHKDARRQHPNTHSPNLT